MILHSIVAAVGVSAVLFFPQTAPEAQAEIPVDVSSQQVQSVGNLTDQNRSTKVLAEDAVVTFTFEQPVSGVYLEWDQLPEEWAVKGDTKEITPVSKDFLHCYMAFDEPTTQAQLQWIGQGKLCDITFLTQGKLPRWVQAWQPYVEKADFLLFSTHADDEHLWFGGIMPLYAGEMKKAVQVVYMVNHQNEPYRQHELLDGLWTVGVRNYPVIPDFPDIYSESLEHACTVYNQQEIIAYQVEQIRKFKPSVIVGQDINGEYGHGAHCLNTDSLMQAVELAADETANPENLQYGVWDTPKTYLHLYPENEIVMDWNQPLAAFDGKTAFEMAQQGYACHRSQAQYWFSVKQSGSYDCRRFGLWRTTVGVDTQPDMLQNIPTLTPEPTSSPTPSPTPQPTAAPTATPTPQLETSVKNAHMLIAIGSGVLFAVGAGIALYYIYKRSEKR